MAGCGGIVVERRLSETEWSAVVALYSGDVADCLSNARVIIPATAWYLLVVIPSNQSIH